jgi:signal transduction histidine kinase
MVEVLDNGAGVPTEHVDRIFDPYQSAHESHGEVESIGLGLSVSRTLARLMGGDLVYERRQQWSVFSLILPSCL